MKRYVLEVEEDDSGRIYFKSMCDGFNALEITGVLYNKLSDIREQIEGTIKPDVIERKVIKT